MLQAEDSLVPQGISRAEARRSGIATKEDYFRAETLRKASFLGTEKGKIYLSGSASLRENEEMFTQAAK